MNGDLGPIEGTVNQKNDNRVNFFTRPSQDGVFPAPATAVPALLATNDGALASGNAVSHPPPNAL